MRSFLVVHGHFYQPPRENPWLGLVERQESARPWHDWNERIAAECYTPNAFARILDDDGRILGIVDNYELISFNFGPTLLSWLEQNAPDTYRRILEGDRRSIAARGHGNAIAQAYNHAILPLCNERDRRTQVRWGIADFESRFLRRPEAIWLPETAVSEPVLDLLVDEGMKFVVLSPQQAEGEIDPTQPYLVRTRAGRALAAFFYDGPISTAIGFQGALASSGSLLDRLAGAAREDRDRDQLVSVATDGESYGHHTRFGERTLAYALAVEAPRRGLEVTNFAAYLAAHPPTEETRLKPGPNGEGTAWSCVHGLGRWLRDCGCSAGTAGFNQAWRAPLRQALDLVRDRAAEVFERRGAELLSDPWAAREAYVQVLLGRPRDHFLAEHLRPGADPVTALRLLEMAHHALLMYTSCGWFFDEISGLEGTQVLRYASRAIEHYQQVCCESLEPAFLALLGEAQSNLPEMGSGADVYRKLVAPSRITQARMAAQEAILGLFVRRTRERTLGDWHSRRTGERRAGDARFALYTGRIACTWLPTGALEEMGFAVLHVGAADVCCAVRPLAGAQEHKDALDALWREWPSGNLARLMRALERGFGPAEHTFRDLIFEEREQVLRHVYGELLAGVGAEYTRLYDNHRHTMHVLRDAGLPIPEPLRQAAEMVLGGRFEAEIARQRRSRDPARYRRAIDMAQDARARGLTLQLPMAQRLFGEMLCDLVVELRREPTRERRQAALDFMALSRKLGVMDLGAIAGRAQELLWEQICADPPHRELYEPLARELGFGALPPMAPAEVHATLA